MTKSPDKALHVSEPGGRLRRWEGPRARVWLGFLRFLSFPHPRLRPHLIAFVFVPTSLAMLVAVPAAATHPWPFVPGSPPAPFYTIESQLLTVQEILQLLHAYARSLSPPQPTNVCLCKSGIWSPKQFLS